MKINFTCIVLFFSFQICLGQVSPPNSSFNDLSMNPCPYDSSQMILTADFWSIYQTQNDRWDGPVDSTQCIEVYEDGFNINFATSQIDIDKPIFIRSKLEEVAPIQFMADNLYNGSFSFQVDEGVVLNVNTDCDNGQCSGLFIGIDVPDEFGTGVNQRAYRKNITLGSNSNFYNLEFCYATERFEDSFLKEYILKLSLDSGSTGDWVKLRGVFNEEFEPYWTKEIAELEISDFYFEDTSYVFNLSNVADPFSEPNILMIYNDTTYPGIQNPSFVEMTPSPNVATQELIDLIVDYPQTLVFQPFVSLRGGLIEGSDSLRHHYNLVNNGAGICMYSYIDFAFTGSNGYTHQGGNIDFHGTTSCLTFENGGTLKVSKDAYLQYGDGGEGILALGEQSRVNLEIGSSLVIDNKVILLDVVDDFEEEIKVDLQPGSLLAFGQNASIRRAAGERGNQMINVYMNGGILDDHELNDDERAMINRIYPETSIDLYPDESVFIYPNPVETVLRYRYLSDFDQSVEVEILNVKGQIVYKTNQALVEGVNDLAIDFRSSAQGIYILKLETAEGVRSAKFIK